MIDLYKKGQADLFNRLWTSMNKGKNEFEAAYLLFKELNKFRDETEKSVKAKEKNIC